MKTIPVDADKVEKVETSRKIGDTSIHKESVVSTKEVNADEVSVRKFTQFVWFLVNLVGIIILLRFSFLLFGANLTGFALIIYRLSDPFVRPFQGIFPAPRTLGSYFDSASILAVLIWYMLGYIITSVISLFSNSVRNEETING